MRNVLAKHFFDLGLSLEAAEWLICLFEVSQVFDDFADGESVDRKDLDATIWHCLVGMPQNKFYMENASSLSPVLALAFLKWKGSDIAERNGVANEKSFVWRAGYYDVVLLVVQLVRGVEFAMQNSQNILSLYGEDFEDYIMEFKDV